MYIQLVRLNSGKFCALVILPGIIHTKTRNEIFINKKIRAQFLIDSRFCKV